MEILLWIIGALFLLVLGWLILKVAIGFFVNPKVTGRAYFRQELKKSGILPSTLSDDCVGELFMNAYHTAEASSKLGGESLRNELVSYIDIAVTQIINGFHATENNRFRRGMYGLNDPVEEILVKYGHLKEK